MDKSHSPWETQKINKIWGFASTDPLRRESAAHPDRVNSTTGSKLPTLSPDRAVPSSWGYSWGTPLSLLQLCSELLLRPQNRQARGYWRLMRGTCKIGAGRAFATGAELNCITSAPVTPMQGSQSCLLLHTHERTPGLPRKSLTPRCSQPAHGAGSSQAAVRVALNRTAAELGLGLTTATSH